MFTYYDFFKLVDEIEPDCCDCKFANWDYYGCYVSCLKESNKFYPCILWEILLDWYEYNAQTTYFINSPYDSNFKRFLKFGKDYDGFKSFAEWNDLPF